MTPREIDEAKAEILVIDEMFENAKSWGSWMVSAANYREELVSLLHAAGVSDVEHKYRARTGDGRRTN